MVVEIKPGIFKCERVGCEETVTAENPTSKRSRQQAQRAAEEHEKRNAIHIVIVDLSTLPKKPTIPKTGFGVFLASVGKIELLSTKLLGGTDAEVEASIWMETSNHGDHIKLDKGRPPKPGSIIDRQR
ncbi:MAG: hypothetical protein Q8Q86_01205, partial [Candidatus Daviesbacteria bacterium]|nr:hypothetical protein [Candidatus Daviesbacteria bacterium]